MRLKSRTAAVLALAGLALGCASSSLVEELHQMESEPAARKRATHVPEQKAITVQNATVVDVTDGQLYMECNVDSPFPQDYQIIRVRQLEPVLTNGRMTGEKVAERIYFVLSATPIKVGNEISFRYTPREVVNNASLRSSGINCTILESISLMGIKGEMMSYDIHCEEQKADEDIVTSPATIPEPVVTPVEEAIATTEPLE